MTRYSEIIQVMNPFGNIKEDTLKKILNEISTRVLYLRSTSVSFSYTSIPLCVPLEWHGGNISQPPNAVGGRVSSLLDAPKTLLLYYCCF